MRLEFERLESRQLLTGFAAVPIPGLDLGVVEQVDTSAYINVAVVESSSVVNARVVLDENLTDDPSFAFDLDELATSDSRGRTLAVGNGFGFQMRSNDVIQFETVTSVPVSIEPVTFEPASIEPVTVRPATIEPTASEPTVTLGTTLGTTANFSDSPVTESPVSENQPTEQPEPDVGVYSSEPQPATDDQPIVADPPTTKTDQNQANSLARIQKFALVSPADIPGLGGPEIKATAATPALSKSGTPSTASIDSVFEELKDLGGDFELRAQDDQEIDSATIDVSELEFDAPESNTQELEFANPLEAPVFDNLSLPTLGVFPSFDQNVLESILEMIVVEEAENEQATVEEAPINPDLPADKGGDGEKLTEAVRVIEGIILIAALPCSLACRHEDDSGSGFSV